MKPGQRRGAIKLTKPTVGTTSRCQTTKTPRRTVFGLTTVDKVSVPQQLQPDFEINRDIFTPSHQRRKQNENKDDIGQRPKTAKQTYIPETDLFEIENLVSRIPNPESVSEDDVFSITPILDRILGTVGAWDQDLAASLFSNKIILNLQNKLFQLIEINDFLVRTITCRILLCFSSANPELLSPISRIFYKLSCDKSNYDFFVDENLEGVLLSLLQSNSQEPSVYAAGSIKNVTKHPQMQEKMQAAGFFSIIRPFFEMDDADPQVITLLSVAIKHMCSNPDFRKEVAQTDFLDKLANYEGMFETALSLSSLLPELWMDQRINLLKEVKERGAIEYRLFIEGAATGAETDKNCGDIILEMIKEAHSKPEAEANSEENQQLLQALCSVATRSVQESAICTKFEKDGVFISILKTVMYDTQTLLLALDVCKHFKEKENQEIVKEYEELFGQQDE